MKKYVTVLLVIFLLLTSCKSADRKESRTVFLLGTVCNVQLFSSKAQKEMQEILNTSIDRIDYLERHLSANADSSMLIDINKKAGCEAIPVPTDLLPVFERAAFFAEKTQGAFNPVLGSVVKLWNIGFENSHHPSEASIQQELACTDYRDMSIGEGTIFLKKTGMKLDLGAIAKGFAADEVSRIIKAQDIRHALVDVGGTICTIGTRPNGKPWIVGIRDPRRRQGEPIISAAVTDRSISTSGSYERYFEQDGIRYHHILDPETGYPVRNNLVSVSIFCTSATDADALSTACFVLGYDKAVALLSQFPDTDALFIFDDNTIRTTKGFETSLHILNTDFRFAKP